MSEDLKLDLGSGPRPAPGFKGVDVIEGITDYTHDFDTGEPWPFESDSVSELRAAHLIEHIDSRSVMCWEPTPNLPNRRLKDLLFHFFDEAYRVAKPGARFEVRCPTYSHDMAHGDPTHRRNISHDLIHYLNRGGRETRRVGFYDVTCNWVGFVSLGMDPPPELASESDAYSTWLTETMERAKRELNVGFELIFQLTAVKP